MITWMQRHKKWLVITIWISTFAFVGAGFVGWGSYKYGTSSSSVATVGKKEIKISDLQNEYNSLYSKYQNAFGEAFNQEMAKQFKLKEAAYTAVIQKFTLLNYADELGLYATDKEIAKYLVQIPAFIKNGKFDKNIYLAVLKQNRTNPTDFEHQIGNDLLINKIQLILNSDVTTSEINNFAKLNSIQDRVSINIVKTADLKIDSSTQQLKKYWEQNKNNYKSLESYKIAVTKVKIDNDKKASKKEALKKYLKLKKDKLKFDETLTIDQNSDLFISANLKKISNATVSKVLKPLEDKNDFIIVKLLKKYPSKALPFDKVSTLVSSDYNIDKKHKLLKETVQKLTNNFTGYDIGFVSKNKKKNIEGLSEDETQQLITHIASSPIAINSLMLENKAIVYKITDSSFLDNNISNNENLKNTLKSIKNNEILSSLLKQLQNRYEIKSNMKVN